MARPHAGVSQAFHQFIFAGRKFPKFSEPPKQEEANPLYTAASPEMQTTHLWAVLPGQTSRLGGRPEP